MDPDPFPRPFRDMISTLSGLSHQAHSHSAWPSYESAVAAPLDRTAAHQPEEAEEAEEAVDVPAEDSQATTRVFPCTFCHSTFRTKHDWQRHERSRHLSLDEWTCNAGDGLTTAPATGKHHCAYCHEPEPTLQHLADAHNHQTCRPTSGSDAPRTFRRKDHLVQHLRRVHHADKDALASLSLDAGLWRTNAALGAVSRCGFCGCQLQDWQTRADHLALHFRAGFTMQDWHGDLGFVPSVAAQVRNAMR